LSRTRERERFDQSGNNRPIMQFGRLSDTWRPENNGTMIDEPIAIK